MKNQYLFFALNKDFPCAQALAQSFHQPVNVIDVVRFADSELHLTVPELPAHTTAVVVHSTSAPVSDTIMQLLLLISALKARGAAKIVAVIPYFAYSRQCQAEDGKVGHAQAIVKALEAVGTDAVVTVEPHSEELKNLFSIPFYPVRLHDLIAEHCVHKIPNAHNCCIVAPDHGARERAEKVAQLLGAPLVQFKKERYGVNKVRVTGVHGGCMSDCAILIDDIIDTGSTALNVAHELQQSGVKHLYGYFVHPVLSGDILTRLQHGPFEKLCVSDTIFLSAQARTCLEEFSIVQALVHVMKEIDGNKD